MFYAKHQAADIFFVMKPYHSLMLLYSGNPIHAIFNSVETHLLLYETVSCLLDPSIRDGDLARDIHALPVKVNRAMQLSLLALSHYVADHDVTTRTLYFPRRQSYVLPS